MRILTSPQYTAQTCREAARPLGLVPTMGALHAGHLALVKRARRENAFVAASIFVNPAQFGPQEDLAQYPRSLERDLDLLRAEGVDLVFAPAPEEVYPPGFDTWVDPGKLANRLEGAERPGHFRGVATVVAKLFILTDPDRAYFGQKDGQQVAIIRRLVKDLNLKPEVVAVPTERESDGLALSSRNVYLSAEQRAVAPVIYRALRRGEALWQGGTRDAEQLRQEMRRILASEPGLGKVDYVSVADVDTLVELERVAGRAMASAAVWLGSVRLIDNLLLE